MLLKSSYKFNSIRPWSYLVYLRVLHKLLFCTFMCGYKTLTSILPSEYTCDFKEIIAMHTFSRIHKVNLSHFFLQCN